MRSWSEFTTAKSLCTPFSGSIFKCAVGLHVICPNISYIATALKTAEMMLLFDRAANVLFDYRLGGYREQHAPPDLFCVADAWTHVSIFMLWNKEGNILQRGRRKFTTPPWQ